MTSAANTVGDFLTAQGITLGALDTVSPDAATALSQRPGHHGHPRRQDHRRRRGRGCAARRPAGRGLLAGRRHHHGHPAGLGRQGLRSPTRSPPPTVPRPPRPRSPARRSPRPSRPSSRSAPSRRRSRAAPPRPAARQLVSSSSAGPARLVRQWLQLGAGLLRFQRRELGRHRQLRVHQQLVDQHRQWLLRWPAVRYLRPGTAPAAVPMPRVPTWPAVKQQIAVAENLYASRGTSPWACGGAG